MKLHRSLTVIVGLDDKRRARLVEAVTSAVRRESGVETAGVDIVLRAGDLPQPVRPAAPPAPSVSGADTLEHAEARERSVAEALDAARRELDSAARAELAAADMAVSVGEDDVETLRTRLAATEAEATAKLEKRNALANERAATEARRVETSAALDEARRLAGDAVADALTAFRRLQSVKPRQSAHGATVADRWVAYRVRQRGELPEADPPPEYLVAPARAALEAARAAVAEAERAGEVQIEIDPTAVEELERAHRRLLEAEQRANLRPSRLNRRRLEGAQQMERQPLIRLGVSDYGDYLRRIVPAVRAGGGTRSLEAAREALNDAEAVWDELHGGVPPMSDDEIVAALARIREEAVELLGHDPGDDALEDSLRNHVERVVDVEWAREALAHALEEVGVDASAGLEPAAEAWLAGSAERRARLQALEGELAALDEELGTLPPFADETRTGAPESRGEVPDAPVDPIEKSRGELTEAERVLSDARAARESTVERVGRAEAAEERVAELSAELAEATALREAAARETEAHAAAARATTARATTAAPSGSVELSLYTIARLTAHRAVPAAGLLPVVVDDAFTDLAGDSRTTALDLLTRVSGTIQVVYLTASEDIVTWADALPAEQRRVDRRRRRR